MITFIKKVMEHSISTLSKEDQQILDKYNKLPPVSKRVIRKHIDELLEKLEDQQDLKDAKVIMKEKSIPYETAMKKIGLR